MHYIERFITHLRESDGMDISMNILVGITSILVLVIVGLIIYGLIEWLGIFIILVPFALIAALFILYGVGAVVSNYIEKREYL